MTRVSKRIEILASKKFEEEKAASSAAIAEESESKFEKEKKPSKASTKLKESKFNQGSWTDVEIKALLKSIKKNQWGEWNKMSDEIKTRSPGQINSKIYKFATISKPKDSFSIQLKEISEQV